MLKKITQNTLTALFNNSKLIIECTYQSHTSFNPMRFRLLARQLNSQHIISRMTSSRQSTSPSQRLIHRTIIHSHRFLVMLFRFQQNHRHFYNKNLPLVIYSFKTMPFLFFVLPVYSSFGCDSSNISLIEFHRAPSKNKPEIKQPSAERSLGRLFCTCVYKKFGTLH